MVSEPNKTPPVRADLLSARPAVHGAIDYGELAGYGFAPHEIIDFSENSNPYGPSPAVRAAIAAANPARYPDRECLALRRVLAAHLGCSPQNIMVGNGAAEVIWLIGFAYLQKNDLVMIVGPTFGEYERTVQLMGGQIVEWRGEESADFHIDVSALGAALQRHQPRILFLCNPNNPTGVITKQSTLEAWASAHPQTLFVIDEAYIDFAAGMRSAYALGRPNILVVRSMTKAYALAGVRLGYALGPSAMISALSQVRIPWSVNGIAQEAGIAGLEDQAHLRHSLKELEAAKADFCAQLTAVGFSPLASATHYMLVNVGTQHESAKSFRKTLLRHGLLVRDCASFGLPHHVRLATHRPEENRRFIACLH